MKHLTHADLLPLAVYQKTRDELRASIIRLKRNRRIGVGPRLTFVFENRQTLRFQVQEMIRVEEITDPAKIQEELDVYNPLMPGDGELSATMFVEFTDAASLREEMPRMANIESQIYLRIGATAVRAAYEKGRSTDDRTSSVHYLKFRLSPAQRRAFRAGRPPVLLETRLPAYRHSTRLPAAVRRALAMDLKEAAGSASLRRAPGRGPVTRSRARALEME